MINQLQYDTSAYKPRVKVWNGVWYVCFKLSDGHEVTMTRTFPSKLAAQTWVECFKRAETLLLEK